VIATVTPNPSLDRTFDVDRLTAGGLHRARGVHVHPGGKGVNVARALVARGTPAKAIVPYGGAEGEQLLALLAQREIDVVAVPAGTTVRVNVAVIEPSGRITKINEPGPTLNGRDAEALLDAVREHADAADWVVSCGSVPPGLGAGFHARVVRAARSAGARVAVDASGEALLEAVREGPDLVKPNRGELEQAVGHPLRTVGDAIGAARQLEQLGVAKVLVSLGPVGALLVSGERVLHAEATDTRVRSTVGAGDALLAGYLAGGGGDTGLETGVAWATDSVGQPGTSLLAPDGAAPPVVLISEEFDRERTLDDQPGAAGGWTGELEESATNVPEGSKT
jgi:1-phosphofructokinase